MSRRSLSPRHGGSPRGEPASPRQSSPRKKVQRSDTLLDHIQRELERQSSNKRVRRERDQREAQRVQRRGGRPRPSLLKREIPSQYKLSDSIKLSSIESPPSTPGGSPRQSPRRAFSSRRTSPLPSPRRKASSHASNNTTQLPPQVELPPKKSSVKPTPQKVTKQKQAVPAPPSTVSKPKKMLPSKGKKASIKKDLKEKPSIAPKQKIVTNPVKVTQLSKITTKPPDKVKTDSVKASPSIPYPRSSMPDSKGGQLRDELRGKITYTPNAESDLIGSSTEEEILKIWEPQALYKGERRESRASRRASQMTDVERHRALVRRHMTSDVRRRTADSIVSTALESTPRTIVTKRASLMPNLSGIENLNAWPGVGIVSLPNREKMIPPGVYFDENLMRTQPAYPMDIDKALTMAGPFGVGEAKACLDDLQATLLHMYSKIYKVEPDLPLDWQIEQLERCYYPSAYPISGNPMHFAQAENLGVLGGALPPPFPNAVPKNKSTGDTEYRWKNDIVARGNLLDLLDQPRGSEASPVHKGKAPTGTAESGKEKLVKQAGKSVIEPGESQPEKLSTEPGKTLQPPPLLTGDDTRPLSGIEHVINELQTLADSNAKHIEKLNFDLMRELGDPTGLYWWRGTGVSPALRRPKYFSSQYKYPGRLSELEKHTETLYRNLLARTHWNNRKIRLLQDRVRVIDGANSRFQRDSRSGF